MNEWKKLNINNLLKDIDPYENPNKKYEVQFFYRPYEEWRDTNHIRWYQIIMDMLGAFSSSEGKTKYRYRNREPKSPRHTEIMTKWWLNGEMWVKVAGYENGVYWVFDKTSGDDANEFTAVRKGWFNGLESADIPPEKP